MMSLMSNEQELEVLAGYRFQRRVVGIGGRQESTVYVGGTRATRIRPRRHPGVTVALRECRDRLRVTIALRVGWRRPAALCRQTAAIVSGRGHFASVVYGFRPRHLRVEAHKPDARLFVEAIAKDRRPDYVSAEFNKPPAARSVFAVPLPLILDKAFAFEAGVLFPAYQRVVVMDAAKSVRVAVNVSYFFWLK